MLLDHEDRIRRVAVLDIVPTTTVFHAVDSAIANTGYPSSRMDGLSEHMIELDPDTHRRCFRNPASPRNMRGLSRRCIK
jgi:hypothetical protein